MVQRKVCGKCLQPFGCNAESGRCWCDDLPPLGRNSAEWDDCLCPECLKKEIARSSTNTPASPEDGSHD